MRPPEVHATLYRGWRLAARPSQCADKRGHTMFTAAETLASDTGSLNAYFEGSQELLHVIDDVLDIRRVFQLVSDIAKRMLPHDSLTMASQDENLTVELEATSHDDLRDMALE